MGGCDVAFICAFAVDKRVYDGVRLCPRSALELGDSRKKDE